MPRRKAAAGHKRSARPTSRRPVGKQSSVGRWSTRDDIPLDGEDSFHSNRDRILLEGDDQDTDEQEEEVFPLQEESYSSDSAQTRDTAADSSPQPTHDESHSTRAAHSKRVRNRTADTADIRGSESEGDEEGWGKKKSAYYSTNAGDLNEGDETSALYLEEASRLQHKALSALSADDFGLHDYSLFQGFSDTRNGHYHQEVLASISSVPSLKSLEKLCPEVIALARDWDNVMTDLQGVEATIKRREEEQGGDPSLGLVHLYHQTLLQYTSLLAFYFYLHTVVRGPVTKLRKHPILARLLLLREASLELEDLGLDDESSASQDLSSDVSVDSCDLDGDLPDHNFTPSPKGTRTGRRADRKSSSAATPSRDELEEPVFLSRSGYRDGGIPPVAKVLHFGDATELQGVDALDKHARKKSIQFHTARIDNSHFRSLKGTHSTGGDDDIPYPEPKRRSIRTSEVQELRQDAGIKRRSEDVPEVEEETDGYYRLVKRQKKLIKDTKKAEYTSKQEIARTLPEEHELDGPRSLTRAILANKGLTAKRAKSVRNPRVKKRMRFEKAQRKLASQKAVYKGGVKETGYGGEMTGISVRTVKSVKLS